MKKLLKNDTLHFTVVLTIVAICCGIAIALTHMLTRDAIENSKNAKFESAYGEVFENYTAVTDITPEGATGKLTFLQFLVGNMKTDSAVSNVYEVYADEAKNDLIGYIYIGNASNGRGSITIAVGIVDDEIQKIHIIAMDQTPSYQDTATENIMKYEGLQVTVESGEIDFVSGATISQITSVKIMDDILFMHRELFGDNDLSVEKGGHTR
ncbi:MAG: FMN-binding protein [Acholeplasmataceae bacterium]|nr:FMN-binding protein [Acholeplasmataceae bacterium]